MTPIEYREFCESTYCAPAHVNRDEYLRLLLIEEVGEVASLFAKSMRDGHEVDRDRLKKELGDVMWAATMLDEQSPSMWRQVSPARSVAIRRVMFECIGSDLPSWIAQYLCLACGFSPEEVALANVEKLRDRQARGVLHGAGDER